MENTINWTSLVKKAAMGNQDAITKIYNVTYAQSYSLAVQMLKDEYEAMDIMQESYISAFRSLETLREPEKFKSWFNCIVANRCRDSLRKKNRPLIFSELETDDGRQFVDFIEDSQDKFYPKEGENYDNIKTHMLRILDTLSEEQKMCILMFYYEDLSIKEIADAFGCSENTVKSRLSYGKNKIKKEVDELEKKGVKLYSIAPIPFLIWMLRSMEAEAHVPGITLDLLNAVNIPESDANQLNNTGSNKKTKPHHSPMRSGAGLSAATKGIIAVVVSAVLIGGVYKAVQYAKESASNPESKVEEIDEKYDPREFALSDRTKRAFIFSMMRMRDLVNNQDSLSKEMDKSGQILLIPSEWEDLDLLDGYSWMSDINMLNREITLDELSYAGELLPLETIHFTKKEIIDFYNSTVGYYPKWIQQTNENPIDIEGNNRIDEEGKYIIRLSIDYGVYYITFDVTESKQISKNEVQIVGIHNNNILDEGQPVSGYSFTFTAHKSEGSLLDGLIVDSILIEKI